MLTQDRIRSYDFEKVQQIRRIFCNRLLDKSVIRSTRAFRRLVSWVSIIPYNPDNPARSAYRASSRLRGKPPKTFQDAFGPERGSLAV